MGGKGSLPRTLDDRGRLAPFPQGGKGGGMGALPHTYVCTYTKPKGRRYTTLRKIGKRLEKAFRAVELLM
ncbi:hypothetical protein C2L64_52500 (plasmid) [Paraburkholderia hospita]|uniref:Uncharacterized protein n=1 Tax=Paraburkholderia hospita TaxID=169430 RepID=A0AAN1JNV6_9BURK|nr:hypothetical protein C2L64_52500 [Paraburkholderia hospita]